MNRIYRICCHAKWLKYLQSIQELEKGRIFCKHNAAHFMDVARLAYLENLERHLGIEKEWIYAAALLHDIGRHLEYTKQIPHDKASAMLAPEILQDCDFSPKETETIVNAIQLHCTAKTADRQDLAGLIYRADKKSRACLFCQAEPYCNWSRQKKNWIIPD